ncbi:MAG: class I SAM-dependent methyltransferase [Planctomycetota bacterium]
MKQLSSVLLLLSLLPGDLLAQPSEQSSKAERLFYRAFYLDQAEARSKEALELYRQFLREAPGHRHAGAAARYALNALKRSKRGKEAEAFAKQYASLLEESARPGINASFLDPKLDVQRFLNRFESESREIYRLRKELAMRVGLAPGLRVADIGAGTGLFSVPFAKAIGSQGIVYAVEISPRFVEHLGKLARATKLPQIRPLLCTERSAELPANSIDLAFICDTYHHFEFPAETMASIHKALKPGGQLVVIDFIRIEGKSRKWILGHVRAGEKVFSSEIESAGFRLLAREDVGLEENYFLRFVKRPASSRR